MFNGLIIIAGGGLAIGAMQLPPENLEIAMRVAGGALPNCVRYLQDGSEMPCLPRFTMRPGVFVNARSIGADISFTHSATRVLSRDEFALMAGHEIAHWHLGHVENNPSNELAADRLGAELACRAGFSPKAGIGLTRLFHAGKVHPKPSIRRATILSVRCDEAGSEAAHR